MMHSHLTLRQASRTWGWGMVESWHAIILCHTGGVLAAACVDPALGAGLCDSAFARPGRFVGQPADSHGADIGAGAGDRRRTDRAYYERPDHGVPAGSV